jgi:hypothetical protein
MDLPTPPFPLTTPMTRRTRESLLVASNRSCFCCRSEQFAEQLEQSWLQVSLVSLMNSDSPLLYLGFAVFAALSLYLTSGGCQPRGAWNGRKARQNCFKFVGLPTLKRYAMIASEGEDMPDTRREEPRQLRKIRVARRSMTYIVRTLLLIIMACIVCIAAFLTAERVSNLYNPYVRRHGAARGVRACRRREKRSGRIFYAHFLENDPAMSDTHVFQLYDFELQLRPER